ncbi:MAG: hypothetical protein ACK4JY_13775 [Brevundimonas sp.]|uniref:hypothetical protein n=1 Tax=Brevundimonas sp. TaxID=1871086 RepID=UPI00391AEB3A
MLGLIAALVVLLGGQDAAAPDKGPIRERSPAVAPRNPSDNQRLATEVAGIFHQVFPHWRLRCDDSDFVRQRIQFDVTVDREGRIVSGPTMVDPQDDAAWRATAESARRALIAAAPFDVPEGFAGGRYRPTFNAASACAAR